MTPRSLLLRAAVTGGAALAVALPSPAGAADAPVSSVAYAGNVLVYTGGPGHNGPRVGIFGDGRGRLSISDSGPIAYDDPRCEPTGLESVITCEMPAGVRADMGGGDDWWGSPDEELPAGFTLVVTGGEGNDQVDGWSRPDTLSGGPGNDILRGYAGADTLDGGDGDDEVLGGKDADTLMGGAGNDTLTGDGFNARPAADVIDGGAGVDEIESDWAEDVTANQPPLSVTLAGGADDGRPGEGDDVRNVEHLNLFQAGTYTGTDGPDHIEVNQVATASSTIRGGGGDDVLQASDAADTLEGGAGADDIDGGFGDDQIIGGPGRDKLHGDHPGGDCGPVYCKLPFGNDTIDARDGEVDSVDCGAGTDTVHADAVDVVAPDCETVERGAAPGPQSGGGGGAGGGGTLAVSAGGARLAKALGRGLALRVAVPGPGRLKAVARRGGRKVATGTAKAAGAGRATVRLRFPAKARRALRGAKRVKLAVRVTFTPAGGTAATGTMKITLRR